MNKTQVQVMREAQKLADIDIKSRLGARPTATTQADTATTKALNTIANMGTVITLLVAETAQSIGAVMLAVVFAILEYQRVFAGATALGQAEDKAIMIAVAVVTANVIVPIYVLRALRRDGDKHTHTRHTVKSLLVMAWGRVFGDEETRARQWTHNGTLHASKVLITAVTIVLAVYDLIEPVLTGNGNSNGFLYGLELFASVGLSVAGVFFLQSASHEIGVRMLTDAPLSAEDRLAKAQADFDNEAERIRTEHVNRAMQTAQRGQKTDEETTPIYNNGDRIQTHNEHIPFEANNGANFTKALPVMTNGKATSNGHKNGTL